MRCPKCGDDQKQKHGSLCSCGYQFIFQGASSQGMTDIKFLGILRRASQNGHFYFTFAQLYTAWCQQDAEDHLALFQKKLFVVSIVLFVFSVACILLFGWLSAVFSVVSLIIPYLLFRQYRQRQLPELGQLKKLVKQWQTGRGGEDEMLLLNPGLHEVAAAFPVKEFIGYGVERIIIVERRLLVDLLVRNAFHADQNALIFSRDGYPASIVHYAQNVLKENKLLPIYLLHDASENGMLMQQKVKLSGRKVIDLGVKPEHIEKMKFLSALQLEKKKHRAPLDILPYPVLATLCGQAFQEENSFSEVLEQWDASRKQKSFFKKINREQ